MPTGLSTFKHRSSFIIHERLQGLIDRNLPPSRVAPDSFFLPAFSSILPRQRILSSELSMPLAESRFCTDARTEIFLFSSLRRNTLPLESFRA